MNMNLKMILKPTWKRALLALGIGTIATIMGFFLMVYSIHGPDALMYLGIVMLPSSLLSKFFGIGPFYGGSLNLLISALIQYIYYYIIISVVSYFIGKNRSSIN